MGTEKMVDLNIKEMPRKGSSTFTPCGIENIIDQKS